MEKLSTIVEDIVEKRRPYISKLLNADEPLLRIIMSECVHAGIQEQKKRAKQPRRRKAMKA